MPYVIGGAAVDEIAHMLSNKTIDDLRGFMGDNFGIPPEFRDLFKDRTPVIF